MPDSFWDRVVLGERFADCWSWAGSHSGAGYGYMPRPAQGMPAHRAAYEAMMGSIPDGLVIDHLCRNRGCVNPWHLEPVTQLENVRRGNVGDNNRAKTHCPKGHPYDEQNTYRVKTGRLCRICKNERWAIYYDTVGREMRRERNRARQAASHQEQR